MAFNFDDHYARLLASMDEVVLLMSQHGADFWSSRISELRERLGEHDAYALDRSTLTAELAGLTVLHLDEGPAPTAALRRGPGSAGSRPPAR